MSNLQVGQKVEVFVVYAFSHKFEIGTIKKLDEEFGLVDVEVNGRIRSYIPENINAA